MASPSVVWFRNDLRLADNPALTAGLARGGPVVPVFIWAPEEDRPWAPGGASRWWLHQSLRSLDASLLAAGSRLTIARGPSLEGLHRLARELQAGAVFWNRRYEPAVIERDAKVKETLRGEGLHVESFNAALLHEPWTIRNQSGRPFQVFTPFWKHCLTLTDPAPPLSTPPRLSAPARWPKSVPLEELELEPRVDWAGGIRAAWPPGEASALAQLTRFIAKGLADYSDARNRPDLVGTSRLSPYLHFGEISPRQIWHGVASHWTGARGGRGRSSPGDWRASQFLTEIGWREFAHHLLYHFPHTPVEPLRSHFKKFPWRTNVVWLKAWQHGRTGYPIVDAGMRELWTTGWMHNRVRMIVASFLVKDLLLSWQEGAAWFWDTLVDADLAQNTLGWQWTAGCGADAAPYFRIFNPVSQGEKFDPSGTYVRRWCPELARLPDRWVHRPWDAPAEELSRAKLELEHTYPQPIVSHAIARDTALEAFAATKAPG